MSCLFFSLSVFVSYLAYVIVRYGIQPSISDSYYRLKTSGKWLFTIATWGYAFPLLADGLSGATHQDLLLLSAVSLIALVGVFPDFRITSERKLHQIGAEGGILLAFIWGLTTSSWYLIPPSVAIIAILYYRKPKNHTWWIEVLAYLSIVLSIALQNNPN